MLLAASFTISFGRKNIECNSRRRQVSELSRKLSICQACGWRIEKLAVPTNNMDFISSSQILH